MNEHALRSIVIAGGGSAAWSAAAVLAQALQGQDISITVLDDGGALEAPAESTLPQALKFHRYLGLDERDLIKITRGTFRLGTEYVEWWGGGLRHFQPLGLHGAGIDFIAFHHLLIKQHLAGETVDMDEYSLCAMAAKAGKFTHPSEDANSILATLAYGLHLDNGWYQRYLRGFAEHNGVRRLEARVQDVRLRAEDGFVTALVADDGEDIEGDFFIDCTRDARLIAGALEVGFEDWSRWLPVNRGIPALSPPKTEPKPKTTLRAMENGWLRQVPLGDKTVNEFMYHSETTSDEEAASQVASAAGSQVQVATQARTLRSGKRSEFWRHNCVALGAAAGGLEPLVISDSHLAQTGAMRLAELLPDRRCHPLLAGEFNRLTGLEYTNLRDYQLSHYLAARKREGAFWQLAGADGAVPDTLARRLEVFASQGQLPYYDEDSFQNDAWATLLLGQNRWPAAYNRCLDELDQERLDRRFEEMRKVIRQAVDRIPPQGPYIRQYLGAGP